MISQLIKVSVCAVLAIITGTATLRAGELQVFAAASLTDALKELAPAYEAESGNKLQFNFAGSNTLARQIQEGAPADVFISADEAKMDALQKAGLILDDSRRRLLSNTLVVVIGAKSTLRLNSPQELTQPALKRIALADPKGVPAGVYAQQYLEAIGLWDALNARVVPTENVRAALAAVEAGNADAGIVYKTDAGISKQVKIAYEVPSDKGPAISYPVAAVKNARESDAAQDFLKYLQSEAALTVFKKYGFGIHQ